MATVGVAAAQQGLLMFITEFPSPLYVGGHANRMVL